MKKIIFDLDGTLALNCHRQHFVSGPKKDWKKFFEACDKDPPNLPVISAFHLMNVSLDHEVAIWSGRSESVKSKTMDWLIAYSLFPDELKMRPIDDYSPDEVLKKRWLDEVGKENILCVFDDRNKVVKMWRDNGVPCFQVNEGNF
jgi:hypothetical protein